MKKNVFYPPTSHDMKKKNTYRKIPDLNVKIKKEILEKIMKVAFMTWSR